MIKQAVLSVWRDLHVIRAGGLPRPARTRHFPNGAITQAQYENPALLSGHPTVVIAFQQRPDILIGNGKPFDLVLLLALRFQRAAFRFASGRVNHRFTIATDREVRHRGRMLRDWL